MIDPRYDKLTQVEREVANAIQTEIDKKILQAIYEVVEIEKWYDELDDIEKLMVEAGYEVKGHTKKDLQITR
jgi:hypothetical protein